MLQGDVGCGKTAVAFLALLAAAGSGCQGALMAPTEVLAEQHAARLGELLEKLPEDARPRAALLKGGMRVRERREARPDQGFSPCSSGKGSRMHVPFLLQTFAQTQCFSKNSGSICRRSSYVHLAKPPAPRQA